MFVCRNENETDCRPTSEKNDTDDSISVENEKFCNSSECLVTESVALAAPSSNQVNVSESCLLISTFTICPNRIHRLLSKIAYIYLVDAEFFSLLKYIDIFFIIY